MISSKIGFILNNKLNLRSKRSIISVFFIIFVLIALPSTVLLIKNSQDSRGRAQQKDAHIVDVMEGQKAKNQLKKQQKLMTVSLATNVLRTHGESLKTDGNLKQKYQKQLVEISKQRKSDLLELAVLDPLQALSQILPEATLESLQQIEGVEVETKIQISGSYNVFHTHDLGEQDTSTFSPVLITDGNKEYRLYADTEKTIKAGKKVSVKGFALGNNILVQSIDESSSGSNVLAATTGPLNTAIIAVNFSDQNTQFDMNAIRAEYSNNPGKDLVSYFSENSYGSLQVVPSYYGPYTIPLTSSVGCSDFRQQAKVTMESAKNDINFLQFKRIIYIMNCNLGGATFTDEYPIVTPQGTIVGAEIWVGFQWVGQLFVSAHEMGHTFGNLHAGVYYCIPEVFISPTAFNMPCYPREYADGYDVMGDKVPGSQEIGHMNAFHKNNAGWLNSSTYITLNTPGTSTHTLTPLAQSTRAPKALYIPRGNSGTSFVVEYRQPIGFDSWITNSIICPYCDGAEGAQIRFIYGGANDTLSIDSTPFSKSSTLFYPFEDSMNGALKVGNTFTDPEYNISIKTLSQNANGLDVEVTVPPLICTLNNPLINVVGPSSQTATAGETKTYTLSLTNNDSPGCPMNTFKLESSRYTQYSIVAEPDLVRLSPGQSINVLVNVKSSPNAADESMSFRVGFRSGSSNYFKQFNAFTTLNYETVSPADITPPSSPTNLQGENLGSRIAKLTWTPGSDDLGVIGYRIYRDGAQIKTVYAPQFVDYFMMPSTSYNYTVEAFDRKSNKSSQSAVMTLTTPSKVDFQAPTDPTNVNVAAIDAHSVKLTWGPSSDNVGVVGYGLSDGGQGDLVDSLSTEFAFEGLLSSNMYEYVIYAFDGDWNASASYYVPTSIFTPKPGTLPPTLPKNLRDAGSTTQVVLGWDNSTDDLGVTGYNIYRNNIKIGTSATNSFTDTHFTNGEYYVQAFDADGNLSGFTPRQWVFTSVPTNTPTQTPPAPTPTLSVPTPTPTIAPDVTAPTVTITSPLNGSTVIKNSKVNIAATASDNVRVSKVEFLVNGALKCNDTAAPYNCSWKVGVKVGVVYTITAKAYDDAGNTKSASITVTAK